MSAVLRAPLFGTGQVPFDSEAAARGFLLSQGYIQISVPRGRIFMPAYRDGRFEIAAAPDGWVIFRQDSTL